MSKHAAVTAEIKNILGTLMINGMPNGEDRLTVMVRHGDGHRARRILAANKWSLEIDVVETSGGQQ